MDPTTQGISALLNELFLLGALAALVGLYVLPLCISAWRQHPQHQAILVLNLLAGWTFLGWLVALVWANTTPGAAVPHNDSHERR